MYDEFVEKARARALKRAVGDPFKVGIEQGPQVTYPHLIIMHIKNYTNLMLTCMIQKSD